jgi:hypothetical protein
MESGTEGAAHFFTEFLDMTRKRVPTASRDSNSNLQYSEPTR